MFEAETQNAIVRLARTASIEPAALLAVAEIESGGKAYAVVNNKREPMIRFEGHYFDRRLSGLQQAQARAAGLSSPKAGAIRNPNGQASRWAMLDRAAAINRKAAYESVSWGIGQVMGAHWQWLGYASVDALVDQCRESPAGQIAVMLRYIEKAGLASALNALDWPTFARGYNGPQFAKSGYDKKLAAAFKRHKAACPGDPATVEASSPQPRSWLGAIADWIKERLAHLG
ncbi:N-acetylmuramidase family protein [Tianweitania sediminis]|uniref:N-acetylmuramidase family protein n=1 Tax=Tianweitania sediminis TaxID=1502156 RepID=A0A8J7RIY4_9HYPH|nr:N-acetylmuramidase family protein [Tianweitania sediminis]MBP0439286.1 N-acetylmuramidase family protein [Tianweitania sediminis]